MNEYEYAKDLATALWASKYKDSSPNWEPLDDLSGVLTQIDNMICGWIDTEYDNDRIAALEAELSELRAAAAEYLHSEADCRHAFYKLTVADHRREQVRMCKAEEALRALLA